LRALCTPRRPLPYVNRVDNDQAKAGGGRMTVQVDVQAQDEVTAASSPDASDAARARAASVVVDSPTRGGPVTDEFQALCEEWLPCMYDWRTPAVPAPRARP
jgi:hypothetical protein